MQFPGMDMRADHKDIWANVAPAFLLFALLFAHVTALRSIALVVTVSTAMWVWRKNGAPPLPLKLPFLLWVGVSLISLLWALDPAYSFSEIRVEVGYTIVYFVAFFVLARDRLQWNMYRGALIAGLPLAFGIAVWQMVRVGTLNADNYLGGVLNISTQMVTVFPLLLAFVLESRRHIGATIIGYTAVILVMIVGYLTFIRNFILAVDAVTLTLAFLLFTQFVRGRRNVLAFLLVIGLTIGSSGVFLLSVAQHRAGTVDMDSTVQVTIEKDPRWDIWRFSLEKIRERPLTGVGFGRFAAVEMFREKFPGEILYSHAHNPFLNYAMEMGIWGVAILCFLIFGLLREFWKLYKCDSEEVKLIGAAGLAMVIGVVIKTQTDDIWARQNGYLFWAVTGMMLGFASRLRSGSIADDKSSPSAAS